MPLSESNNGKIFRFPELPEKTFYGLPGLLDDSLPDRFGNQLIDLWLATQGSEPGSMNPVERLCYIGKRGIGLSNFALQPGLKKEIPIFSKSQNLLIWLSQQSIENQTYNKSIQR